MRWIRLFYCEIVAIVEVASILSSRMRDIPSVRMGTINSARQKMAKKSKLTAKLFISLLLTATSVTAQAATVDVAFQQAIQLSVSTLMAATPFQSNDGDIPPKSDYTGPLFALNYAWPERPSPKLAKAPWQAAIGFGTINTSNAAAYANALKSAVSINGRALIAHYDTWDAAKAGWFNEPWLGSLREAIHGGYAAGEFGPGIFPNTGLRTTFRTTVVTYYNERAAYTLSKVWGKDGMTPKLTTQNTQFEEGSIIVKVAFFWSTDPLKPLDWWDAMKGGQIWNIYTAVKVQEDTMQVPPRVWPSYVAQFDIIVKDSKSAPKTGWVFTTLVYDSAAPGDAWDKMIPLGAQWGNDPQATKSGQRLIENWINPDAPQYAVETLGWGGRLTGPNDGGRNDIAVNGATRPNEADSSCMSCHSPAQWNVAQHKMPSFLLPSFPPVQGEQTPFLECGDDGKPTIGGSYICSPAPASAAWMKWFQNRLGTQPMDVGSVATDFDMVLAFKSLPLWWIATHQSDVARMPLMAVSALVTRNRATRFNQYNGAPLLKSAPGDKIAN